MSEICVSKLVDRIRVSVSYPLECKPADGQLLCVSVTRRGGKPVYPSPEPNYRTDRYEEEYVFMRTDVGDFVAEAEAAVKETMKCLIATQIGEAAKATGKPLSVRVLTEISGTVGSAAGSADAPQAVAAPGAPPDWMMRGGLGG